MYKLHPVVYTSVLLSVIRTKRWGWSHVLIDGIPDFCKLIHSDNLKKIVHIKFYQYHCGRCIDTCIVTQINNSHCHYYCIYKRIWWTNWKSLKEILTATPCKCIISPPFFSAGPTLIPRGYVAGCLTLKWWCSLTINLRGKLVRRPLKQILTHSCYRNVITVFICIPGRLFKAKTLHHGMKTRRAGTRTGAQRGRKRACRAIIDESDDDTPIIDIKRWEKGKRKPLSRWEMLTPGVSE